MDKLQVEGTDSIYSGIYIRSKLKASIIFDTLKEHLGVYVIKMNIKIIIKRLLEFLDSLFIILFTDFSAYCDKKRPDYIQQCHSFL